MKKLLITFGCSWTFGVGVRYQDGMKSEEYKTIAWDRDAASKLSFRAILSEKLGFDNINFSAGGSSNQKQFRLAKEFFFSNEFKRMKKKYSEVVVLWGITSTARNELYNLQDKEYLNFFYHRRTHDENWPFPRDFLLFSYDHDIAVREILFNIKMFSTFFDDHGIKYLWFDTFNHHEYKKHFKNTPEMYEVIRGDSWPSYQDYCDDKFDGVPGTILTEIKETCDIMDSQMKNFLFFEKTPRDMLTLMLEKHNLSASNSKYLLSNWSFGLDETEAISLAVKNKLLNPHSTHPTVYGHQVIAEILEPEIQKLM